jgi:hypothetical protein
LSFARCYPRKHPIRLRSKSALAALARLRFPPGSLYETW